MTRPLRLSLALLLMAALGVGLALAPSEALAQDSREAARAEFERGRTAYESGAFREALDHFQEAYRIAPHPSVRLNIASCYDQLERPVEALVHYEGFLVEAERPQAAQRREVEQAIARLRRRVGTLTLQVTPDGATITIDGTETRRAPVAEPVRVVAGSHTIEVRLEGYRTDRQSVEVQGGANERVSIRLERGADPVVARAEPAAGSAPAADTASTGAPRDVDRAEPGAAGEAYASGDAVDEQPSGSGEGGGGIRITTPVVIAASATGVALIGAAVFGGLALHSNDVFELAVLDSNDPALSADDRLDAREDGLRAADNARTFAAVTDVFLVAAVVGAGVTTALFIIDQGEDAREDDLVFAPILTPHAAALSVQGRF